MTEYVSLHPFREAFVRSGRTIADVAAAMECDESYVRRLMGHSKRYHTRVLKRSGETRHYVIEQTRVSYETGVRLMQALGLDPFEVGL